jgi:hypothetical protein
MLGHALFDGQQLLDRPNPPFRHAPTVLSDWLIGGGHVLLSLTKVVDHMYDDMRGATLARERKMLVIQLVVVKTEAHVHNNFS